MLPSRSSSPNRDHESKLWEAGFRRVVGIDEVGRGALAGPVTVAAVILPANVSLEGVRDSKLLTRPARTVISQRIKTVACAVGIGWAGSTEIDRLGLTAATALAAARALGGLAVDYDAIILDGRHNYLATAVPVSTVIGADRCCLNVAAASVVAKVARDNYMKRIDGIYPRFGFASHVGYGTPEHLERLADGLSPFHRTSFAPVRLALEAGYVD